MTNPIDAAHRGDMSAGKPIDGISRPVTEQEIRAAQSTAPGGNLETPRQIAEALTATLAEYGATTKGLPTGDPEMYIALDVDGPGRRSLRITIGYRRF